MTPMSDVNCRCVPPKTPQQIRDEIVERAKADVEKLKLGDYFNYHRVEFVVNREKRTIVALILADYDVRDRTIYRGIAKADPSDCFNSAIGKAISLRRALGLEVPAEYYSAPAPTEVRVGDVILRSGEYVCSNGLRTVKAVEKSRHYSGQMFYRTVGGDGGTDEHNVVKIIDDSREG